MGRTGARADEVVLGVDLGSSRIKVGAYARDGSQVALVGVPTPIRRAAGQLDFPVLDMLAAVDRAVRDLGLDRPVRGVGIGAMGEVGTLLTHDGLADLQFPAWYDERGADEVAAVAREIGTRRLAGLTGGHVRTTSTLAKLAWLRATGTELRGTFLGLAGAVCWRLTGAVVQEGSLAVTSGGFDPLRGCDLPEVWASAGLGDIGRPAVQPVGGSSVAGGPVARTWGLVEQARVVVAGHDHLVAAVGAGVGVHEVADSLGTGEPVLAVVGRGRVREAGEVADLVDQGFTVESWPPTGDLTVAWEGLRPGLAMDTFLQVSDLSRQQLDDAAPAPGQVVPLDDAAVVALERGEPGAVPSGPTGWAALVDAYARRARDGELAVRAASGASGPVVLTGGGTRSRRWVEAKVALLEGPGVLVRTQETAARGAAAMAGVAVGWWSAAELMPGLDRMTTDKPGRKATDFR
ncbi:MAG: hypothetical protein KJ792_10085 [Actinobacteria bacterium]|nr:hypothetical protein [Actinomycetota bacterium]